MEIKNKASIFIDESKVFRYQKLFGSITTHYQSNSKYSKCLNLYFSKSLLRIITAALVSILWLLLLEIVCFVVSPCYYLATLATEQKNMFWSFGRCKQRILLPPLVKQHNAIVSDDVWCLIFSMVFVWFPSLRLAFVGLCLVCNRTHPSQCFQYCELPPGINKDYKQAPEVLLMKITAGVLIFAGVLGMVNWNTFLVIWCNLCTWIFERVLNGWCSGCPYTIP